MHNIKGGKFILYEWVGERMDVSVRNTVHKITIKSIGKMKKY